MLDNQRPQISPLRGLIYGMALALPLWFFIGLFIGWFIKP